MTAPSEHPLTDVLLAAIAKARKKAAREAMDLLDGPDRVEVIRHYLGSAKKACPPRVEYVETRCGCCDCCDCGAS